MYIPSLTFPDLSRCIRRVSAYVLGFVFFQGCSAILQVGTTDASSEEALSLEVNFVNNDGFSSGGISIVVDAEIGTGVESINFYSNSSCTTLVSSVSADEWDSEGTSFDFSAVDADAIYVQVSGESGEGECELLTRLETIKEASPLKLEYSTPNTQLSNNSTPAFQAQVLGGGSLQVGDAVSLHKNGSCAGTALRLTSGLSSLSGVSGSSVVLGLHASAALAEGTHIFSVKRSFAGGGSVCSNTSSYLRSGL